jgi:peroxiredoxin
VYPLFLRRVAREANHGGGHTNNIHGCSTEIIAFNDAYPKFKEIGCELLGCSVDSAFSHLRWINVDKKQGGLAGSCTYPLIADVTRNIAKDYGVLLEVRVFELPPWLEKISCGCP